jgi:hypothetical protein
LAKGFCDLSDEELIRKLRDEALLLEHEAKMALDVLTLVPEKLG